MQTPRPLVLTGLIVAAAMTIGVSGVATSQAPGTATRSAKELGEKLEPLIRAHKGDVAVAVKDLTTGVSFAHGAHAPMPTASMIKLAIMVTAYRQAAKKKIDLGEVLTLATEDKVPGSGILTPHFSAGATITLRDAIRLMIAFSDNTATNLVLDCIGLPTTRDTMKELGYANTAVYAKVFRRDTSIALDESKRFGLGSTNAAETIDILERLHAGRVVSKEADAEMIAHLAACRDRLKFPRFLPPGTRLAHKTGSVSKVRCAGGIIYAPSGPIALCVLTANNADVRWTDDNAGDRLCARIARAVYRHFNGRTEQPVDTTLANGDLGKLVEDLQRTLNARLKPSPALGVDGDFGPATEAAVLRFQETRSLKTNGIVDAATWKALGVLVTRDKPVPDPTIVNREKLPTAPPDKLDGPPFVTCTAWALADGRSGALLHGHEASKPLPFASVTKVMTAYIAVRLAAEKPAVLEEIVTVSRRSDDTPGSTAGLRAGETLPLGELLYGLMLPSGNDAATAVGEHLGGRFAPKPPRGERVNETDDPLAHFITEMNRTAQALGMKQTRYRTPHGLPAKGHVASAHDLLKLVHAALKFPLFREIVTTRQHGYRITGVGGYQRNLLWKSTNRLLAIEGYSGVKTGTTRAAGACLASASTRGDDRLLLVVLGSKSSPARYADSRNLFRWAWRERLKKRH